MFKLIAAVGKNRELGKHGDLCFHIKADMAFFKETTMGHAVLMGLKTWESLPAPLKGRDNYVLSRDPDLHLDGATKVGDLDKFIDLWYNRGIDCFIVGGGSVYQQLLPYCQELYLTEIDAADAEADTFFPDFDKSKYRREVLKQGVEDGINYSFVRYTKL